MVGESVGRETGRDGSSDRMTCVLLCVQITLGECALSCCVRGSAISAAGDAPSAVKLFIVPAVGSPLGRHRPEAFRENDVRVIASTESLLLDKHSKPHRSGVELYAPETTVILCG